MYVTWRFIRCVNKVSEHNVYLNGKAYLALFRIEERWHKVKLYQRKRKSDATSFKTNHNLPPLRHTHTHTNAPTAADEKTSDIDAFHTEVGVISLRLSWQSAICLHCILHLKEHAL